MSATTYPQSSIPTPPFSPRAQAQSLSPVDVNDHPLKSTINLLDALIVFYQHERMWVYRTRATLENAFQELPPINPDTDRESLPSPLSDSDLPPEDELSDNTPPNSPERPKSQWLRRKKGFKLRMDGLDHNRRAMTLKRVNPNASQRDDIPPREKILEMFEKIMETRMESCQRINKLVRNANRADLHHR